MKPDEKLLLFQVSPFLKVKDTKDGKTLEKRLTLRWQ